MSALIKKETEKNWKIILLYLFSLRISKISIVFEKLNKAIDVKKLE